jgi:selenium metabolism protein YedF
MSKIVDARGLACPQPVILTRNALQESDAVTTIVDNETARGNVSRLAAKQGCQVDVEEREDGFYLHLTKGEKLVEETAPQPLSAPASGPLVLTVPSDIMGRGDEELGGILVRAFFHTLGEVEPLPQTIIFFNSGVKLVVEGSPVLEDLQALQAQGVEILACGTCLGHYELKDKVAIGEVSNMYTIAETLLSAGKVVSL